MRAEGKPVRTPGDLRRLVGAVEPGDAVTLALREKNETREVTVGTVEDTREPGRAVIGILVGQSADIDLPVDVNIDLGDVGGPSAGLAFALDVMEELGRDVDHGYRVAATGELELDGTVADRWRRPEGDRRSPGRSRRVPRAGWGITPAAARSTAGDLRIIPVESFQQALRALATLPRKG